jgi:hypothetical protein
MPEKLQPWEQHTRQNTLDGQPWGGMITYWRRTTAAGEEVVKLFPEGLNKSQCWAWMLDERIGEDLGSDMQQDIAMQQADAALRQLGYEP